MNCFKVLFTTLFVAQLVNGNAVLKTGSGAIRGKTVGSGKVEAFLGIPYAEPPVGPLRFAKPVPKRSWNGVYDATQLPPPCVQANIGKIFFTPDLTSMSEDCLYLNVWMPHWRSGDKLKTVMLFIHGGGFSLGSSSLELYDGTNLAEFGDVVLVTMNYRLGSLGFFSGFTEDAPGSQGVYDQVLAMQWIKDNAKHFHGDPDNIVIFGESAGAFSVSMHQVSPLSKKLFRRVILQSGSAVNPMFSDKNEIVFGISLLYGSLLGCISPERTLETDPKGVTECLRSMPMEAIAAAETEAFRRGTRILLPRIGNDLLPENTIDMYRKGYFKDTEVLMGITRDEGSIFITLQQQELFGLFGEKGAERFINETTAYYTLQMMLGSIDKTVSHKIIRSYLDNVSEATGYTYVNALSEVAGDNLITCGTIFQAEYQSLRGNPVFFYMFDHRTASAPFAEWMGVAHGEEIQYVFGNPMHNEFTEYEKVLSRDVMNMWVTFAKTGNPNVPGGMTWPGFTIEDPKYLIIGNPDRVGTRPDNYRCERWRKIFRSEIDDSVIQALKRKRPYYSEDPIHQHKIYTQQKIDIQYKIDTPQKMDTQQKMEVIF